LEWGPRGPEEERGKPGVETLRGRRKHEQHGRHRQEHRHTHSELTRHADKHPVAAVCWAGPRNASGRAGWSVTVPARTAPRPPPGWPHAAVPHAAVPPLRWWHDEMAIAIAGRRDRAARARSPRHETYQAERRDGAAQAAHACGPFARTHPRLMCPSDEPHCPMAATHPLSHTPPVQPRAFARGCNKRGGDSTYTSRISARTEREHAAHTRGRRVLRPASPGHVPGRQRAPHAARLARKSGPYLAVDAPFLGAVNVPVEGTVCQGQAVVNYY
jgi:hypothetical protein